jgi:hypothetical protein
MKKALFGVLTVLASTTQAYDPMYSTIKSSVINFNKINFDKQITKNRDKGISVVQFYNGSEQSSK